MDFDAYLDAPDRFTLWTRVLAALQPAQVAEVGVLRGAFAARLLQEVDSIRRYWMIDPWRHLDDWNKPANTDDATFEAHFAAAMQATDFAAGKRAVLRGRTVEVIDGIGDGTLDFVYIDGDHTLRGITLDLIACLPKLREGGWIAGDDFCASIWQHPDHFEPTLVFPWAVHFAEAHGFVIHALPHHQFALQKRREGFRFVDHTGRYPERTLQAQLAGGGRNPR